MDTGLQIRNCQDAETPFPQFTKPKWLGYFSLNARRMYEPNASQLRYYKPPPPNHFPLDLNVGYPETQHKPESAYKENINHLLKFIMDHPGKTVRRFAKPSKDAETKPVIVPEFVCWRGLLRLLMGVPYERREGWTIHVTSYMGTCYLCKQDTAADQQKRASQTARDLLMTSWGFKFEQYCLAESPQQEADPSQPVNECEEFTGIFQAVLAGMHLLYGAEMDGVNSKVPVDLTNLSNIQFVELKTRQKDLNAGQRRTYANHKSRNWWSQSYLVGIEDIYVGLRSDSGLVLSVEHCPVRSLTKIGQWRPNVCMNFLKDFLRTVRNLMAKVNCPHTTYAFTFEPQSGRIFYDVLKGKTQHSFLPDWYIGHLKGEGEQIHTQASYC